MDTTSVNQLEPQISDITEGTEGTVFGRAMGLCLSKLLQGHGLGGVGSPGGVDSPVNSPDTSGPDMDVPEAWKRFSRDGPFTDRILEFITSQTELLLIEPFAVHILSR